MIKKTSIFQFILNNMETILSCKKINTNYLLGNKNVINYYSPIEFVCDWFQDEDIYVKNIIFDYKDDLLYLDLIKSPFLDGDKDEL